MHTLGDWRLIRPVRALGPLGSGLTAFAVGEKLSSKGSGEAVIRRLQLVAWPRGESGETGLGPTAWNDRRRSDMAGQAKHPARFGARLAIAASLLTLAFGLSTAPALANPGNGNGNPNPPGNASSHVTNGTAGTVGSPTSPQPLSNADNSGHGANTNPGPYTSTRNGSPSLNGNGTGQAVGKPCAGCVGKADNKNPPGQFPNGSDPNSGYECDRNNGIGQTNPAHTGCAASPPVPETPPVPVTPPGATTPPGRTVSPTGSTRLVTGASFLGVRIPSVSVPMVSVPTVAPQSLPRTGTQVLITLLVGLGAIASGSAMTLVGRRRVRKA
jgi:LPXTG-motif cell wall-anchored protein